MGKNFLGLARAPYIRHCGVGLLMAGVFAPFRLG